MIVVLVPFKKMKRKEKAFVPHSIALKMKSLVSLKRLSLHNKVNKLRREKPNIYLNSACFI